MTPSSANGDLIQRPTLTLFVSAQYLRFVSMSRPLFLAVEDRRERRIRSRAHFCRPRTRHLELLRQYPPAHTGHVSS